MSNTIKVAINSLKGDDEIGGHTGKCRKFWVFTVDNGAITDKTLLKLAPKQTIHNVLNESGDQNSPILDAKFIISAGIGNGAANQLKNYDVHAVVTPEASVDKAIELLLEGKLPVYVQQQHGHGQGGCSCGGHGHDHDHDHGHGHNHEHGHSCNHNH